jgi:MerR family transcriptional regulator, heat shock protein HspR
MILKDMKINDDEPIYSISTAARLLHVSVHILRKYEREGLFIPFKKKSLQRLFSQADINRIDFIRTIINEQKISINGIKTIYSLIPCWEIVKCSYAERNNCKAYSEGSKLCWINNKADLTCENKNCHDCSVYNDFFSCGRIKDQLKIITMNNN